MKVVMIGAGIASIEAAEAVRNAMPDAQIDIFSRENFYPYRRPALTRMISQELPDNQFYLHPVGYYREKALNIHLGVEVITINAVAKEVVLSNGSKVNYDKLFIGAGGNCFIPPIQGNELPGVVTLRDKAGLDNLKLAIANGANNVSVIGGGLLGLEIADNLLKKGVKVTVLEACPNILPRQLDEQGAEMLFKIMQTVPGLETHYGVFITDITGKKRVEYIQTQSGQEIPCDLAVICTGVKCNTETAASAGANVNRAIVVNEHMETSIPDIYAGGDCAAFSGQCNGLWQPARDQGAVAGANIAGAKMTYHPMIYGARLNAFGAKLFAAGDIGKQSDRHEYETICDSDELQKQYKKLFFKNRVLVGAILLGDTSLAAKLERAVSENFTLLQAETAGLTCKCC
jgi:nitrite reductase (NADH) large subunit